VKSIVTNFTTYHALTTIEGARPGRVTVVELIKGFRYETLTSTPVDPSALKVVAITGQYALDRARDERGEPGWRVRHLARHARRRLQSPRRRRLRAGLQRAKAPTFIRRTGGALPLRSRSGGPDLLLLNEAARRLGGRALFMNDDTARHGFCGIASADARVAPGHVETDKPRLRRLAYDQKLLASVGLTGEKLPDLVGRTVCSVPAR